MPSRSGVGFQFSFQLCLPALLLGALAMGPARSLAAVWPPLPADTWTQQARPDSGGRDAIILSEEGTAQDRGSNYRFTRSLRLRIFTEEGRDAGKVEIDYLKGTSRLVDIAARSIREDGTATELSPDQVLTTTILKSGGTEYSRATAIVPGIEPGCVVEYHYTLEGKSGGFWVWPWSFQNDYYTVASLYRWQTSSQGFGRPRWSYHKIAESMVERACTPDCDHVKEVVFVAHDIPGARNEAWAPPLRDAGAGVVTFYGGMSNSSIDFWSLWKRALDQIATDFGKDIGGLAKVVDQADAQSPDSVAALAEVCRWIRTNLHSTAELSWEDLQANQKERSFWGREATLAGLIKRGEGSPYELNLALATAAQRLGFDSCVCLLRDRREGVFDYDVIGALPTEPITAVKAKGSSHWSFYQAASRFAIPANVPWYLRGGPGLVAGPGEYLTVTLHPEDGALADARWALDLTLDGSGGLSGRFTGAIRGEQAREYRSWLWTENPALRAGLLKDDLSPKGMPDLELAAVDLGGSPDSAFAIGGTARYPLIAAGAGAVATLPVEKLAPWRFQGDFDSERRTQPIFFRYPRHEVVTVDLHLPPKATVEELPRPGEFENEVGAWRTSWSRIEGGIRYERSVEVDFGEMPARRYAAVRAFFRGLAEADRELLLVNTP
jgi:hypothetical protein